MDPLSHDLVEPRRPERFEARLDGADLSGGDQFLQVLWVQGLQGFGFDALIPVHVGSQEGLPGRTVR